MLFSLKPSRSTPVSQAKLPRGWHHLLFWIQDMYLNFGTTLISMKFFYHMVRADFHGLFHIILKMVIGLVFWEERRRVVVRLWLRQLWKEWW